MIMYFRPWLIVLFKILFCSTKCLSLTNMAIYNRTTIGTNTMPLVKLNVCSMIAATSVCNNNGCLFVCTLNNSYYIPNFTLSPKPAPIDGTMTCFSTKKGKLWFTPNYRGLIKFNLYPYLHTLWQNFVGGSSIIDSWITVNLNFTVTFYYNK